MAVVGRGYHTMLSRAVKEKVRRCAAVMLWCLPFLCLISCPDR